MTNNGPNPLQQSQVQKPSVYRPRYRVRTSDPSYALEGTLETKQAGFESLVDALEELDAWQAAERADHSVKQAVRWHPSQCMALTVFIPSTFNPPLKQLFCRALRQWEAASEGRIRFELTTRPDQALIKLQLSDNPVLGREFEVGHTDRTLKGQQWLESVTMTFIRHPRIDDTLSGPQLEARWYVTFLHELGHSLGLEHSQHRRDVMYHQGWQNTQLTRGDTQSLLTRYADNQTPSFVF